jgi:hypothetical protein
VAQRPLFNRAENCDVLDLPPLSDSIDPEALDTLATENTVEIQFEYLSYTISIENGMVTVSQ